MSNSVSAIPALYSVAPLTFASKADYLAFVAEWKMVYRHLSLAIRERRLEFLLTASKRPAKVAHLTAEIGKVRRAIEALGPVPAYVAAGGNGKYHRVLCSEDACWLIGLRIRSKHVAGLMRLEALGLSDAK